VWVGELEYINFKLFKIKTNIELREYTIHTLVHHHTLVSVTNHFPCASFWCTSLDRPSSQVSSTFLAVFEVVSIMW